MIPVGSNPKLQVPNPNEIPTPKIPTPPNIWDLDIGSALGFGAWSLGFDTRRLESASPLLLFGRIPPVLWRAGSRRSHEDLAAVGEGDVAAVRPLERVVLRLVSIDDELGAVLERFPRQPAAQERVRRPPLDHPHFGRSIRLLHLD